MFPLIVDFPASEEMRRDGKKKWKDYHTDMTNENNV
jgi:hypothetical protein